MMKTTQDYISGRYYDGYGYMKELVKELLKLLEVLTSQLVSHSETRISLKRDLELTQA